ncbi:hypothetical protein BG000_011726 [Podila horticola]|nr:hypothetical protein BG000_011726 [Podila horticola]
MDEEELIAMEVVEETETADQFAVVDLEEDGMTRTDATDEIDGIVVLKEGHSVANFQTKFDDIALLQNGRGRTPTVSRKHENVSGFAATVCCPQGAPRCRRGRVCQAGPDRRPQDCLAVASLLGFPQRLQRKWNLIAPYCYQDQASSGVTANLIDTGINTNHAEFGGRITMGANFINGTPNTDENGHGTHIGVTKNVTLVGVKVLAADGRGSFAAIVAGMDWVALRARGTKAAVNMPLGADKSQSLDAAANRVLNAWKLRPKDANVDACTVSVTDRSDRITTFLSWGPVN